MGIESPKQKDFPSWYQQVVIRSELLDYYDISGFYVLRPWAYSIWENIQCWLDTNFKATGVKNVYFPLLVTEKALNTEKDHIKGFAPEVAWVTRTGDKELDSPLAIRPTSETIIYPIIAKWIHSYRDLPLLLNQWNSVVRWEFDHPFPFLRSREFLWQEGHTAWEKKEEAEKEVLLRLDTYRHLYEDLLAVPVISGKKTEKEKFSGSEYTTTIESFVPSTGKGIQAATSHHLGQNFSKIFGIKFLKGDVSEFVWQNSWGLTTRSIGIMVMIHGDDNGLVLPPRVAPIQVVVIPIFTKDSSKEEAQIKEFSENVKNALDKIGVRVHLDDRTHVTPGYKYNQWELKGVPLRLEVGPRDLKNSSVLSVQRHNHQKKPIQVTEIHDIVPKILDTIQLEMFVTAKEKLSHSITKATNWKFFDNVIEEGKLALCPFCESIQCEEHIKQSGKGKALCIPFSQDPVEGNCIVCEKEAKSWTLFGKSY